MLAHMVWVNRIKAIVLGLGLGLALHTGANWLRILIDHVPECGQPNCVADFVTFHAEGTLISEDRRLLYDLDQQLAYQNKLAPVAQVLPFVYPPITALVLAPLGLLPFPVAFLVMTLLNLALLVESLRLLIRRLSLTRDQSHWLGLYALCSFGAHAVVFYGQTSALVLYFLIRHVLARKQSRDYPAGGWAGLLCVKPQYLPIPHLVLLLHKNWRGLAVGIGTSVGLIVGAFIFVGAEASKQYFVLAQRMVGADNDWWNQWRGMHNLRALTAFWLPAHLQTAAWLTGCAAVAAAVIGLNLRARARADGFALSWIVNLLGLLIIIPHLFTHDLSLLILPCALFLSLLKETVPVGIGLGLVVLAALPVVNYLLPTLMGTMLVILFALSLILARRKLATK